MIKNQLKNATRITAADDGTNIKVSYGGTDLFRVVKASGQFEIAAGVTGDVAL